MSDCYGGDKNRPHVHFDPDDCVLILKPDTEVEYLVPENNGPGDEPVGDNYVALIVLTHLLADKDLYHAVAASVLGVDG